MNLPEFSQAVQEIFGPAEDFVDHSSEDDRTFPRFSAIITLDGMKRMVRLSNPYHPKHWNAILDPSGDRHGDGVIGESTAHAALIALKQRLS